MLLTFIFFFFGKKLCCPSRCQQVVCKMFIVWSVLRSALKNWYLKFYTCVTHIVYSNRKILSLTKGMFIKVFLQGKVLYFGTCWQIVCKMFISEVLQTSFSKKYYLWFIWHKLFIQMVKYSFYSQWIVYQSFYGMLLMFSYSFFKEKSRVVSCFGMTLLGPYLLM